MDDRLVLSRVRTALEHLAATEMQAAERDTAADEIAARIVPLFRALQGAFEEMAAINEYWLANGISDEIGAAAKAGTALAGYSPETWATWGQALPQVQAFLTTEYQMLLPDGTVRSDTPKTVLMRKYARVG